MPKDAGPQKTYGVLTQTHPSYNAARLQELHDLVEGGYAVQDQAKKYLVPLCNEHTDRHAERCRIASCIPYFGQIVGQFVAELFSQPLSVMAAADADDPNTPGENPDAFYDQFAADVDLRGTSFVDMMDTCARMALIQRDAFFCIDAPTGDDDNTPVNLANEDAAGLRRMYGYDVSPREVIDWKEDDRGGFKWIIRRVVEQDRDTPESDRSNVTETFTVWRMAGTPSEPIAHWDRYVITYDEKKKPSAEDIVPWVDGDDTAFRRIPLLRLRLPKELWAGNKLGPAQLEHWNRRSALIGGENRSMVAIPVAYHGPEANEVGGAIPSQQQQNTSRGRNPVGQFNKSGFMEMGDKRSDSVEFAEPHGHCYELVEKQLETLKDEMFRVNHQMAASIKQTSSAVGRSGLSKQSDQELTAKVLRALGRHVRQFALLVYETISDARGDDVVWTVNGLDNYETIDREMVIEEAISVGQVLEALPSPTFAKTYAYQVASKLMTGIDPLTQAQIKKEIEDAIDDKLEMLKLQRENDKDELENPPPPTVQVPTVKPPTARAPLPPKPALPKLAAAANS